MTEVPRSVTIRDVAERAGVSKSLVSLVLRGAPHVSEGRRSAVLEAMNENIRYLRADVNDILLKGVKMK